MIILQVVDFRRLLSHHDQRLAHQLNHKFYKEERDYGKFSLGRNQKFTEQVVITQARIDQANLHNDKYRYLKQEIEESEKRVNQAQAGSIRDRPLSAPDLTRFEEHKQVESISSTMKRRLQSAPPRVSSLNKIVSSLNKIVSSLNNIVSSLNNIVSSLNKIVSSLNNIVSSLNKIVSSLNKIVSSLNNIVSSLNNIVSSLNKKVSSLNNIVNSLNNIVSSLNNIVSSLNKIVSSLNKIVSSLNNIVSSLNNIVSSLNNIVSSLNKIVSSLNNIVSSLNNIVSSLNKIVSSLNNIPPSSQLPKPIDSHSPKPPSSQLPKPIDSHSPKPIDSHSPKPPSSQLPKPIDSHSPKPIDSHSPKPPSSQLPKPIDSHSPKPPSSQLSKPIDSHSPKPHSSQLPKPIDSHSPKPPGSQLPKPIDSHSPKPPSSQLPKPIDSHSPKPPSSQLPKPIDSHSPKPPSSQLPKPIDSHSPKPIDSHSPKPPSSQLPKPIDSHSPKPIDSHSPKPPSSQLPKPIDSHSPKPPVKRKSEKGSTCTDTTVPLTPRAVSADDVREMTTKMAELQFEIVTSDCRSQLNLEAEIDFYLPGYLQRRLTQDHVKFSEQVAVKKPEHWTLEILERLTNPKGFKRNSHDRCCDAGQLPGRDLQQRNSSEINFAKFKGADKTQRVSLNIGPSKNTQQDIPREDCRETKTILTKSCKDQPETLDGPHVLPEDRVVEANKETLESMSQDILNQKSCAVEEIIQCEQSPSEHYAGQKRVSWATNDIVIAFTDQSYLSHPHIEPVVTVKDKEGLLQILSPAYTETGETRQKEATRSSTTAAPRVRERAQQRDSLNGPSRPCGGDKGNAPACESNTSTVVNDKLDLLTAALDQAHPRCETFNRQVSNISNNKNKIVGKELALQSNAFISLRSSDTNGRQQARSVSLARDKATEKNRRLARSRLLARIRCARSEDYLNCIN
nr:CAunnamed protein product [Biomphalaria glabrata]